MNNTKWKCRIAPSLGGGFSGIPQECWGCEEYNPETDKDKPCVFFGLYGLPDFFTLWRHKGRKAILWCGSDIRHFVNGYWLDEEGSIKLSPKPLATWINKNCESYVENYVEKEALAKVGIESKVVPSFLGDLNSYPQCYQHSDRPKVYTSVSGDDFKLYGWDKIPKLANENPNIQFHLYGNTEKWLQTKDINLIPHNVFIHGRVSIEQMDEETKEMQGALRLTEFDGFSEIVAKSLLWGQHPISVIEYPGTIKPENIQLLHKLTEPNKIGRNWLLTVVNQYPWNGKI
jgi:hypothetical protein